MVAPATAIVMICLALPAVARGQPAMLLPNRAYRAYWTGRAELSTSILRPFLQHMRVRPYLVYALVDAALTAWVFGQVFGVVAAVRRLSFAAAMSVGLCWGLDLHMRRQFVAAIARQQQQQVLLQPLQLPQRQL
jgi:ABC-type methionine transport system permease subunit